MGLIYNSKEIWDGDSSGEELYKVPSGFDGFFISPFDRYGSTPDIGKYKAISDSGTLILSKKISECDNGILIYLSPQVIIWMTDNSMTNTVFVPKYPVTPTKMVLKKDSPSVSMKYGVYADDNTTYSGSVSVSGNQMKFSTFDIDGTGYLSNGNRVAFWAIKSIVSY